MLMQVFYQLYHLYIPFKLVFALAAVVLVYKADFARLSSNGRVTGVCVDSA